MTKERLRDIRAGLIAVQEEWSLLRDDVISDIHAGDFPSDGPPEPTIRELLEVIDLALPYAEGS